MNCADTQNRIHAYIDGELDLTNVLDLEEHLSGCSACKQVHQKYTVSHTMLMRHATYYAAPSNLRGRIRASIQPGNAPIRLPRPTLLFPVKTRLGAALAFSIVVTCAATFYFAAPAEKDRLPEEIVSSHVRSLMSGRLADVASTDRRVVKPWFSGKLDFPPPVDDLASRGFALVGGRLDYIKERRVAALVYSHRGHPINVFVWPAASDDARPQIQSHRGYNLVNWTHAGMFFCAVSDLSRTELVELARIFQAANG